MSEHKSFEPSDFSLTDLPGFIAIYFVISAAAIALGLLLESIPQFWKGFLVGIGFSLVAAFFLLTPKKKSTAEINSKREEY